MAPQRIETVELKNGLTLTLYDASRKIAGDRWQVNLEATIEIEVAKHHFSDKVPLPAPLDQIRAKLGDTVSHTYQVERNFVDQQDKATLFGQMQASLMAKKPYYDHNDFAGRFIIKEFARCRHLPDATE